MYVFVIFKVVASGVMIPCAIKPVKQLLIVGQDNFAQNPGLALIIRFAWPVERMLIVRKEKFANIPPLVVLIRNAIQYQNRNLGRNRNPVKRMLIARQDIFARNFIHSSLERVCQNQKRNLGRNRNPVKRMLIVSQVKNAYQSSHGIHQSCCVFHPSQVTHLDYDLVVYS